MSSTHNTQSAPLMIVGEVASAGLARGRALLCDCARTQTAVPLRQVSEAEVHAEVERFDAAVVAAEGKLLEVQENVRRTLGKDEAEIFEAQILLLRDAQLHDAVRELCLEKRMNVEAAVERSDQAVDGIVRPASKIPTSASVPRPARRRQTPPRSPGGRRAAGCSCCSRGMRDRHQRNSRLRRCPPGRPGRAWLDCRKRWPHGARHHPCPLARHPDARAGVGGHRKNPQRAIW
jgi:hypothetical protein